MNLKEQLKALQKAMRAIVDGAKASKRDLSDAEMTDLEAKSAEAVELKAKIERAEKSDALMAQIADLGGGDDPTPRGGDAVQARSLGEHFIKALNGRSLKTPGTFAAPEFKAATDAQAVGGAGISTPYGPLLTDVDRTPVLPYQRRLVIADLFGAGSVAGNAITYPVYPSIEGGTGTVKEGGAKPQLHQPDPSWQTDALSEVAGWFKLTDDMAEDLPYVVSEINTTAVYDLQLKEEIQLLSGDGTAPNVRGILNRPGVQTAAQGSDTIADAVFRTFGRVSRSTPYTVDAIVISPTDYETVRLAKDGNGQYYGGGVFTGQYGNGQVMSDPPLWGRRTVVTAAIPDGMILVGAFASGKVLRKGGLRVESVNSHADDFTNGKITVRVRERLGLQAKYPGAFVKLTLGAGA